MRRNGAESLVCPQERFCKDKLHIAERSVKSLVVDSYWWHDLQMCSYKFAFSTHAGRGDILKVQLGDEIDNLFVRYFVGTSLSDAQGTTLANPGGQKIRIAFPYSLYILF